MSVVMPAFNCEKSIGRALESVLAQTLKNFEIVIVNDGSTDSTGDICEEYSKRDSRIKVIHTENGGVSKARNSGIRAAQGEYLRFLDSDDVLSPESLETTSLRHKIDGSDFVIGGYTEIDSGLREERRHSIFHRKSQDTSSFLNYLYPMGSDIAIYPCWTASFRADIVRAHQVAFPIETSMGEDQMFSIRFLQYAETVSTTSDTGYKYFNDVSGSLTKNFHIDMYESQSRLVNETLLMCRTMSNDNNSRRIEREYSRRIAAWASVYYAVGTPGYKEFRRQMSGMRKDEVYIRHAKSLKGDNPKERVLLWLFRHSLWLPFWLAGRLYRRLKACRSFWTEARN